MYYIDYVFYDDDGLPIQSSIFISAKNKAEALEKAKSFQLSKITVISCVKM